MMSAHTGTAAMDPWVLLTMATGEQSLFGFCTSHHRLGGLSWVLSTPVVQLDEHSGVARTRSGTVYLLGRRAAVDELTDREAEAALGELIGIGNPESGRARLWLTACKMARWLGLPAPARSDAVGVAAFLVVHGAAYCSLRAARPGGHSEHAQPVRPSYWQKTTRDSTHGAVGGGQDTGLGAGPADERIIYRATQCGVPVIVARADQREMTALAGPEPSTRCRDELEDWTLVAISGLEKGIELHALGWRATLATEWITSAIAVVSPEPTMVLTTSGHAYRLATPDGAQMKPTLREHLHHALLSWGFDDIRAA